MAHKKLIPIKLTAQQWDFVTAAMLEYSWICESDSQGYTGEIEDGMQVVKSVGSLHELSKDIDKVRHKIRDQLKKIK